MRVGLNGRFYGAVTTGVQRVAREVAARLVQRTDAALLLPAWTPAPDLPPQVPIVRGRFDGHLWEQAELPGLARAAGCDVVVNLANTAPSFGGPHVVLVHDVLPLTNPELFSGAFARWYRFALGRAVRAATVVVTVSEWTRNEMARVLRVPVSRVRVMKQGIEPFDRPAAPEDVDRIRAKFDVRAPYILAVGAGDPRKNLGFLSRVLAAIGARHDSSLHLVIVGEAQPRIHGRGGSAPLPSANIHVLGRVSDDELRALYTGATALCAPSLAEGFGRSPLEAMACGTPALVAPYGAAAEVLGEAAQILPLDPERWADAIEALGRPDERERITELGRRHVTTYRWDTAVDVVVEACEAAVGRRAPLPV